METGSSNEQMMRWEDQVKEWREELLLNLSAMYQFKTTRDPNQILPIISGFSVRARYMQLRTASSNSRVAKDFRYEEIMPFLQECEFQRQTWSRVGTLIKDDWEMAKG